MARRPREPVVPASQIVRGPDGTLWQMTPLGPGLAKRPSVSFADVARQYLAATHERDKPSTRWNKRRTVEQDLLPILGNLPIESIDRAVLRTLQARLHQGHAATTTNTRMAVCHAILRWASEELELIPRVPHVAPLKRETTPKTVPRENYERVLRGRVRHWMRALLLLAGDAGLRVGEAIAMQWDCVTPEGLVVRRNCWRRQEGTPKSGKARTVPMTRRLAEHLSGMPRSSAYVLGSLRLACTIRSHLRALCGRLSVPRFTVHALRHSFASELQRRGVPLQVVRDLLGHSSIAITDAYLHATSGDAVDAIARLE